MLTSFLFGEFLLNIRCCLLFCCCCCCCCCCCVCVCVCYLGSFSYTSRAGFIFIWGVSLPEDRFILHIRCLLILFYFYFIFYLGTFIRGLSLTSHSGFIFIWGVSPTHPELASFLSGEFFLHFPRWLHFYAGSFTYTSRAVF